MNWFKASIVILAAIILIGLSSHIYFWHFAHKFQMKAKLLNRQIGYAGQFGYKKYMTLWDVGEYGVKECEYKSVFFNAKEESILEIREMFGEYYITSVIN